MDNSMQDLIISMLQCSIRMSIPALIYIAITPLLNKRYTAKWCYYMWLIIIMGYILPFKPHFHFVYEPSFLSRINQITSGILGENVSSDNLTVLGYQIGKSDFVYQAARILWILGVIIFISYHTMKHRHFVKMVNRWSKTITEIQVLDMVQRLQSELNISRRAELKLCSFISSPMMIGLIRPVILLPSLSISADELRYILKHEMIHFKRKDLWYKSLVMFATAIHWFNPLIYIIAKKIAIKCEISCDADVVKNNNMNQRQEYCEAIIGVIKNQSGVQTAFSTCFYGSGKELKNRIFSIMDTGRKKTGIFILCMVLMVTISVGTVYSTEITAKSKNTGNRVLIISTEKSISTIIDSEDSMQQYVEEKQYKEFKQ
jgi:beta-lactamase regulating signal transducer with metallopeptidase domain